MREIASLIRDIDRHGKARIVDANEGEEPEEMIKVNKIPDLSSDCFIQEGCFFFFHFQVNNYTKKIYLFWFGFWVVVVFLKSFSL